MIPVARQEIAQQIASLIADDCMLWPDAKRKVMASLATDPGQYWPSDAEIETAIRSHFALFSPQQHQAQLQIQRLVALDVLTLLSDFDAFLSGSVLNGSAHADSTITIDLFCDDSKSVEIALLNQNIEFEAITPLSSLMPEPLECLGFLRRDQNHDLQAIRINIYSTHLRGRNPYCRAPDDYQTRLESSGRISKTELLTLITP